ncbi:hypothetical protein NQ317_015898 [Molorchus minor]|uniref:Chloride channel CLIC-like protein 1 n=1 Tax=Molorchus minor TaxID=1323400 RepID=A0ABQ9JE92_9CUCU|nr:hypothetical protein NQ317_015898 [Molorchus minor]
MKHLFVLFLLWIIVSEISTQWIDPHDMNSVPHSNLNQFSNVGEEREVIYGDIPIDRGTIEENNSLVYLKRFVSLFLNSANINKNDPMSHGKLHFRLDKKSYQFLNEFSSSDHINVEDLRKLDTILSDIFHRDFSDDISDIVISTQEKVFTLLFSKNSLPLVGLCVFVYIAYNLFRSNFSLWYVLRYFLVLILLLDYVQRYQQLYEDAEEHNMHLEYTSTCDTSKMSWGEYFKFLTILFVQNNLLMAIKIVKKKVVSLLEVWLLQVKSLIIIPLSALGTGMGQFGGELWSNLPFPWNILIFPIMLIFCAILAVIIMTTINGTPFKVNLMHLFHFELGEKKNFGRATREKMIEVMGRPMVEDVRGKRNEKSTQKRKSPSDTNKREKLSLKNSQKVESSAKKLSQKSPSSSKVNKADENVNTPDNTVRRSCDHKLDSVSVTKDFTELQ